MTLRLHSMHGFGVAPARWAATYGATTWVSKSSREVEHEVFDTEGVGGPAGVVDIGHAATARVALAAPQAHRHADDVVAFGGEERGGDRRVDAAAHRHHHLHARSPVRRWGAAGAQRRDRRGEDVDGAVDVGVCGRPAERHPQGACRPARLDAHRGEHVRRLHRPAGARRRRRGAQAGLVEEEQQRLALDALDADVRPAGDLDVGRNRLADAVDGVEQAADQPIAQRRRSRAHSAARSASVAPRAAAIATIPGTLCVPLRRSRSCPPPTSSGSMATPLRTTSTPTPFGPPNLWALSDIRSTCGQSWRRSSQHAACTASVCSKRGGRSGAHDRRPTAREVVDRADLVVDRHHRHDRHVVVECRRRAGRGRSGRTGRRRRRARGGARRR